MRKAEVESRFKVPSNGVDMIGIMRSGWAHSRSTFAGLLFDDAACRVQNANQNLRARCFFDGDLPVEIAAKREVVRLITSESTVWTLKCPVKDGEGKEEVEDPADIARRVLGLSESQTRGVTRDHLFDLFTGAGIVSFSTVFTHRNMFENIDPTAGGRPDVVTWDDCLCHHDVLAGRPARRIVEVETQVVLNCDETRNSERTKQAQNDNVKWAREHLFRDEEWLEVSGHAAMCILLHLPAHIVAAIQSGRKVKMTALCNSFRLGEITAERVMELWQVGVLTSIQRDKILSSV